MKPFKKTKPKNPTILQEESNKLKQKLQLLKQQVTLKKQQKQMIKTASSLNANKKDEFNDTKTNNKLLTATTKNNQYQTVDIKFQNALLQMKIENIQSKLKQKGIKTYDKLINLTDQQIDQWKDLLVGYRIKLKKFIKTQTKITNLYPTSQQTFDGIQIATNKNSSKGFNQQLKKDTFQNNSFKNKQEAIKTGNEDRQLNNQKNIEDIIKQRQKIKTFVPLTRQIQDIQEQQQYEYRSTFNIMTQQDQDVMIRSFMKVIHPRKGILKKLNKNTNKKIDLNRQKNNNKNSSMKNNKIVHWSAEVERMEKQFERKNHRQYPKQAIKKQFLVSLKIQEPIFEVLHKPQMQKANDVKYCWKCFKKIDLKSNINFRTIEQQDKIQYFCSKKCQSAYMQQVEFFCHKVALQKQFQCQQKQTDEQIKYGSHKEISCNSVQRECNKQQIGQDEDDLECIDLSIL